VDEQQWLSDADPTRMVAWLRQEGKLSERKARLFAVACCRAVAACLTDRYARRALLVAERYADAEVSRKKLGFARGDARRAAQVRYRGGEETAEGAAMWAVVAVCEPEVERVLRAVAWAAWCGPFRPGNPDMAKCLEEQADMLRDVVGNPFRAASADLRWLTTTVVDLAKVIYHEREFDRLPILADALMDAGCDDEAFLGHCREHGKVHVKGCWLVDLVLGKPGLPLFSG
jgi:hypothetical protein